MPSSGRRALAAVVLGQPLASPGRAAVCVGLVQSTFRASAEIPLWVHMRLLLQNSDARTC